MTPDRSRDAVLRLLILDVDGTCLTSDKCMLPQVKDAIRAAADSGLYVAFATGRMYEAIADWVQELKLQTPQICNNGADLIDPLTGNRFANVVLAPDTVRLLIDTATRRNLTPVLFSGPRVLGLAHTEDDWLIERNNEFVTVLTLEELTDPALPVEKLLFLSRSQPGLLPDLRDELYETWPPGSAPFDAQVSETGILNFCHPEATKLRAARKLCQRLGLSLEQTAAVGDGENDAELIAAVGFGVAMGNAADKTRRAARAVVADNDNLGVVAAIRDHILPRSAPRKSPN